MSPIPTGAIVNMEVVRHPRLRRADSDDGARPHSAGSSSIDTSSTDGCGSFLPARSSRNETLRRGRPARMPRRSWERLRAAPRSCSAFYPSPGFCDEEMNFFLLTEPARSASRRSRAAAGSGRTSQREGVLGGRGTRDGADRRDLRHEDGSGADAVVIRDLGLVI